MLPFGDKRARVQQACEPCRARRLKCTGQLPCNSCEARGDECVFDAHPNKGGKKRGLPQVCARRVWGDFVFRALPDVFPEAAGITAVYFPTVFWLIILLSSSYGLVGLKFVLVPLPSTRD